MRKVIAAGSIGLLTTKTIMFVCQPQTHMQEYFSTPCIKSDTITQFGNHIPPNVATFPDNDPRLHSVHVFVRHGARSPLFLLPKETPKEFNATWQPLIHVLDDKCTSGSLDHDSTEKKNENQLKPFFGQLTTLGINQSRTLGQMLRLRYIDALHFLPSSIGTAIDNSLLYFRSTPTSRTKLTAKSILHGLYPETNDNAPDTTTSVIAYGKHKNLELFAPTWQHAYVSIPHYYCGRLREFYISTRLTPLWKSTYESIMPHLDTLKLLFGKDCGWLRIMDLLQCRIAHGVPLPNGLTDDLIEISKQAALFGVSQTICGSSQPMEADKLSSGVMLSEIMKKLEIEKREPKFSVYTGHDTGMISLLKCLGMYQKPFWPPYCSSIVLELWHNTHQNKENEEPLDPDHAWFVRVIFCPGQGGGIVCGKLQPCETKVGNTCIANPLATTSYSISLSDFKSKINPLCIKNDEDFKRMCRPIECNDPPKHSWGRVC